MWTGKGEGAGSQKSILQKHVVLWFIKAGEGVKIEKNLSLQFMNDPFCPISHAHI